MLLYFKTKTCIQIEHSNIKLIFITYLSVRAQSDSTFTYVEMADTIGVQELQEAVVRGHLPQTKMKGDGLEVIGRGAPAYYVNGRRIQDMDELKRLMSDEVSQVEVIMNPGAMYDATVIAQLCQPHAAAIVLAVERQSQLPQPLRRAAGQPHAQTLHRAYCVADGDV